MRVGPKYPREAELAGGGCPQERGYSRLPQPQAAIRTLSKGKRQRLEGRVLASFHLDSNGKVTSVQFLRAEAPPVIETAACNLLHNLPFDLSSPGVDVGDPRPLLVTVRFCISNCTRVATYANTKDKSWTASRKYRDRHEAAWRATSQGFAMVGRVFSEVRSDGTGWNACAASLTEDGARVS